MKPVIVLIPVFQEQPTNAEACAITQCFRILGTHPICLICPEELDITAYQNIADNTGTHLLVERFDVIYFNGIEGYNNLLLSLPFYKRFKTFEYLLIHQTDAWVFRDELLAWCSRSFDYIGAPWFEKKDGVFTENFAGVGNGGFSLRKTKTALRMLKRLAFLRKLRQVWYDCRLQAVFKIEALFKRASGIFKIKQTAFMQDLLFYNQINEDHYWTEIIAAGFSDFKIASASEASRFAFEVNPRFLYQKNNNHLPFGCHAWARYDEAFWIDEFITCPDNEAKKILEES